MDKVAGVIGLIVAVPIILALVAPLIVLFAEPFFCLVL